MSIEDLGLDFIAAMFALAVVLLGVAAAFELVRMFTSIVREARAARARRWWL